jgi:hypothetical protein
VGEAPELSGSGFLPKEAEEERELAAGAILGPGARTGLALLVGMPFLEGAEAEAGVEACLEKLLKAAVEGNGLLTLLLSGVHDDGDAEGAGVGVEAAVLDFALLIEAPGSLAGDAEAGMIEGPEKTAARMQDAGGGGGGA